MLIVCLLWYKMKRTKQKVPTHLGVQSTIHFGCMEDGESEMCVCVFYAGNREFWSYWVAFVTIQIKTHFMPKLIHSI